MIDLKEFSKAYTAHLNWLSLPPAKPSTLEVIFNLFIQVSSNGGWVRTIGLDNWSSLSSIPNPREFYESSHLVSYERLLQQKWPYSAELTKSLNYSNLKRPPLKTEIRDDEWEEVLSEDLFIYRDVYKFGISKDLISLKSLQKKHGNEKIPVIVQESDTSGFSVKKSTKQKMKLKNYISIMEKSIRDDKYIRFAVNIDFGNWEEEIDEMRKHLPASVLWCSDYDSLKHLRQNILGMSLPQLYLKINGCWTGGHEENLRFPSANINHGPSACEWWGLDPSQSLQFRECIKADYGFEIYNSETLWWPEEIYCLSKGFTVYHIIQEPGDLVIVGSGTIHWVKSLGVTTNTAWNFGPKYLNNFRKSFERCFINQAISYRNLVPLHILSMDLVNNELNSLDVSLVEFLRDHILYKANLESEEFASTQLPVTETNSTDNIINCEICYQELFRFYYRCKSCVEVRRNGRKSNCFFCFLCIKSVHSLKCSGEIEVIQKFTAQDLEKLLREIDLRIEGKECCGNIEGLKYPFEKNVEEGVYVSLFNGIKFDGANDKCETALHMTKAKVRDAEGANEKPEKVSDNEFKGEDVLMPKRRGRKVGWRKPLRSDSAKKSMNVYKSVGDVQKMLKGFLQEKIELKAVQEDSDEILKLAGKTEHLVVEMDKPTAAPDKKKREKKLKLRDSAAKSKPNEIDSKSKPIPEQNLLKGPELAPPPKGSKSQTTDFSLLPTPTSPKPTAETLGNSLIDLPQHRYRSRDAYSPVINLVPTKKPKN